MRLHLVRSGGFTGVPQGCRIETARLDPDERHRVEAWARSAAATGTHAAASTSGARDLFAYRLTIEHEGGRAALAFDDDTFPENLGPLVEWMCERLEPLPRDQWDPPRP